jgi:hypothetical protein
MNTTGYQMMFEQRAAELRQEAVNRRLVKQLKLQRKAEAKARAGKKVVKAIPVSVLRRA